LKTKQKNNQENMMKKTKKKWNVHTAVTSSSEGQASSPSKGQASLLSERANLFP
jgi:hypothetical protein